MAAVFVQRYCCACAGRGVIDRGDVEGERVGAGAETEAVIDLEAQAGLTVAVQVGAGGEAQFAGVDVGYRNDLILCYVRPTAAVVLQGAGGRQGGDLDRGKGVWRRIAIGVGAEVGTGQYNGRVFKRCGAVVGAGGREVDQDGGVDRTAAQAAVSIAGGCLHRDVARGDGVGCGGELQAAAAFGRSDEGAVVDCRRTVGLVQRAARDAGDLEMGHFGAVYGSAADDQAAGGLRIGTGLGIGDGRGVGYASDVKGQRAGCGVVQTTVIYLECQTGVTVAILVGWPCPGQVARQVPHSDALPG